MNEAAEIAYADDVYRRDGALVAALDGPERRVSAASRRGAHSLPDRSFYAVGTTWFSLSVDPEFSEARDRLTP